MFSPLEPTMPSFMKTRSVSGSCPLWLTQIAQKQGGHEENRLGEQNMAWARTIWFFPFLRVTNIFPALGFIWARPISWSSQLIYWRICSNCLFCILLTEEENEHLNVPVFVLTCGDMSLGGTEVPPAAEVRWTYRQLKPGRQWALPQKGVVMGGDFRRWEKTILLSEKLSDLPPRTGKVNQTVITV